MGKVKQGQGAAAYLDFDIGKIQRIFKIHLSGTVSATKTKVVFPAIHIIVEKIKSKYIATCVEFMVVYEHAKLNDAVYGVINLMEEYYLTVLGTEGVAFLYEKLREDVADKLWAGMREYYAKLQKDDLTFVEKSLKGHNTSQLEKKLKGKYSAKRVNPIEAENKRLTREYREMKNELREAHKRISQLTYGIEKAMEMEASISTPYVKQLSA